MNKEEFRRRRAAIKAKSDKLWGDIEEHRAEEERVIDVLHNAESILEKLDMTFEERTSLSKTDVSILMLATALQLVRIYCLPKFQEKYLDENRLDHEDDLIKEMDRGSGDRYLNHLYTIEKTERIRYMSPDPSCTRNSAEWCV